MRRLRVAFIGNFDFPFSSESHHKWTFEHLGHEVIPLQENRTTTDQIVQVCQNADVLAYTHTHSWLTPGSFGLEEMLRRVHAMGVKTYSYHLDIYWGLRSWDDREAKIGVHPSWHVQKFYSTDGRQLPWASRGVNHVYLPAGVVEYGCYMGKFNHQFASDIGFVGSANYHPEYPFRTMLIDALRKTFGPQFRIYNGVREDALNQVYASCKIVVGDHCFAGIPRYASDRLFETTGRGGFIIYPKTEGVTDQIPGLATYEPQNIVDLFNKIAYFINNEQERIQRRNMAHEWVKNNATYTHRLAFILKDLGF